MQASVSSPDLNGLCKAHTTRPPPRVVSLASGAAPPRCPRRATRPGQPPGYPRASSSASESPETRKPWPL